MFKTLQSGDVLYECPRKGSKPVSLHVMRPKTGTVLLSFLQLLHLMIGSLNHTQTLCNISDSMTW